MSPQRSALYFKTYDGGEKFKKAKREKQLSGEGWQNYIARDNIINERSVLKSDVKVCTTIASWTKNNTQ